MQVAETFGERRKAERGQQPAGRKARRALSLGSQQQGQTGSDSGDSSDFGAHPPHPHWERIDEEKRFFRSPHALLSPFGSLDVLGFPHSVRHSLSQTGLSPHRTPRECAAHITHSVRVVSACYFRTCMRHLSDPVLDGPFPQFRSHGRINGTGPGNSRA